MPHRLISQFNDEQIKGVSMGILEIEANQANYGSHCIGLTHPEYFTVMKGNLKALKLRIFEAFSHLIRIRF